MRKAVLKHLAVQLSIFIIVFFRSCQRFSGRRFLSKTGVSNSLAKAAKVSHDLCLSSRTGQSPAWNGE